MPHCAGLRVRYKTPTRTATTFHCDTGERQSVASRPHNCGCDFVWEKRAANMEVQRNHVKKKL